MLTGQRSLKSPSPGQGALVREVLSLADSKALTMMTTFL